jgi:hypothetical protein
MTCSFPAVICLNGAASGIERVKLVLWIRKATRFINDSRIHRIF